MMKNEEQKKYQREWARNKRAKLRASMSFEEILVVEQRRLVGRFGGNGWEPWNKGRKTGQKVWNKGKTKETDERIRLASLKVSKSVKELWRKPGYEGGNKKGVKFNLTEEQRQGYSDAKSGRKNPMYGKSRELSPAWRGGVAFFPYSYEFGFVLRKKIKVRDEYTCQICGIRKHRGLHVHHIDYDKRNDSELNLVTLCICCHGKTRKNREYWRVYLSRLVERRYYHDLSPFWKCRNM